MGHIGLTPQSINQFGGHKIQGKTPEAANKLLDDALALEQAGAFAIVLETVPAPLATLITQKISIPTIGIGAGPAVTVRCRLSMIFWGSPTGFVPKHAKQYAKVTDIMKKAFAEYQSDVKTGVFPAETNSFPLDEAVLEGLK